MAETATQASTEAPGGSAPGMPQLDPTWWGGQIVWLALIFLVLYLVLSKVLLPKLGRGIDGPMAGFSHPEMLAGVYRLFTQGRVEEANDMFDRYLPLLSYEAQGAWGVAARKEVMRRRGAIRHATMRTPGPRLTKEDMAELDMLVRRVEKAVAEAGYASKEA